MTDNRTTELRGKLDALGIEHLDSDLPNNKQTRWNKGAGGWGACYVEITRSSILPADSIIDNRTLRIYDCTPEQAIAATLGSGRHAYEQRIIGDGSDWGEIMRDAYDSLMANACESCTSEQMEQFADYIRTELGSNKQAGEAIAKLRQTVRDAFSKTHISMLEEGNAIMRAIDDVEAAELGSGTSMVRLAERLRGIADEMRNVGASTMTPHELLACYASDVDKVADSLTFAATLGSESVDYMLNTIGKLEEENERLRSSCGTLTAEQVREIIERNARSTVGRHVFSDAQYGAIADELNAELGSGTCEMVEVLEHEDDGGYIWYDHWECSECGGKNNGILVSFDQVAPPKNCPNCGKAVKR